MLSQQLKNICPADLQKSLGWRVYNLLINLSCKKVILVLITQWSIMEYTNYFITFYLFLYGWIAGGWEAHFRNYRHFVSQCPVSTLDWLPNFPHKAWVDPGEGSFTCQVNRCERESNRDRLCSNRSPWTLYHYTYTLGI